MMGFLRTEVRQLSSKIHDLPSLSYISYFTNPHSHPVANSTSSNEQRKIRMGLRGLPKLYKN